MSWILYSLRRSKIAASSTELGVSTPVETNAANCSAMRFSATAQAVPATGATGFQTVAAGNRPCASGRVADHCQDLSVASTTQLTATLAMGLSMLLLMLVLMIMVVLMLVLQRVPITDETLGTGWAGRWGSR